MSVNSGDTLSGVLRWFLGSYLCLVGAVAVRISWKPDF
jgi:hypothetical protein